MRLSFNPRILMSSVKGMFSSSTLNGAGCVFEADIILNLFLFVFIFHNFSYWFTRTISLSACIANSSLSPPSWMIT